MDTLLLNVKQAQNMTKNHKTAQSIEEVRAEYFSKMNEITSITNSILKAAEKGNDNTSVYIKYVSTYNELVDKGYTLLPGGRIWELCPDELKPGWGTYNDKITISWKETEAPYVVKYYQQNVNDDNYTVIETINFMGTIGVEVTAPIKVYNHFNCITTDVKGVVKADGSLVLEVYYDRDIYTVLFNGDGGTLISGEEEQYIRYQGNAIPPEYTKLGYTFDTFSGSCENISRNTTLTAIWIANTDTAYTVEYYQQNFDNDDYTLVDTLHLTGTTGTEVTAPERTYEHFECITEGVSGIVAPDGGLVLEVYYDRDVYTVTTNVDGVPQTIVNVKYGTTISMIPAATKESDNYYHYTFSYWSYNGERLDDDYCIQSNIIITAEFNAIPRFATIKYYFIDKSNGEPVNVSWIVRDTLDAIVSSGSGYNMEIELGYGEYRLITDLNSSVYSYEGNINIDSSKLDNIETKNIEIAHNNVGMNCDGVVEYSGTSDAAYTVHITSADTTFTPYHTLNDGEAIGVSLKFNHDMGYNTEGTTNEANKQLPTIASTFGGLSFGVTPFGYKRGNGTMVKYAFASVTHTVANELDVTFDLIYARLNGNIYLLGKMSTDENYSLLQYINNVNDQSDVITDDNNALALNLKITGTGDRKFDYTYNNFRCYTTADYDELVEIYDYARLYGHDHKIAPMPETTNIFRMIYDTNYGTAANSGYGTYVDKTYDISAGTVEITFNAQSLYRVGSAPWTEPFVGITMTDPTTGNFLNIGFEDEINSNKYLRASVYPGNGYSYRYTINPDGNVDGKKGKNLPSNHIWLCYDWNMDYRILVHGDEWKIYIKINTWNNGSTSEASDWLYTGTINIKQWMQHEHLPGDDYGNAGGHPWSGDVENLYPSGNNVCFGFYTYYNGNGDEHINDFRINDFTVTYTPD